MSDAYPQVKLSIPQLQSQSSHQKLRPLHFETPILLCICRTSNNRIRPRHPKILLQPPLQLSIKTPTSIPHLVLAGKLV
jgi:hypothetical protein